MNLKFDVTAAVALVAFIMSEADGITVTNTADEPLLVTFSYQHEALVFTPSEGKPVRRSIVKLLPKLRETIDSAAEAMLNNFNWVGSRHHY